MSGRGKSWERNVRVLVFLEIRLAWLTESYGEAWWYSIPDWSNASTKSKAGAWQLSRSAFRLGLELAVVVDATRGTRELALSTRVEQVSIVSNYSALFSDHAPVI